MTYIDHSKPELCDTCRCKVRKALAAGPSSRSASQGTPPCGGKVQLQMLLVLEFNLEVLAYNAYSKAVTTEKLVKIWPATSLDLIVVWTSSLVYATEPSAI
jgi:hypothetical protein